MSISRRKVLVGAGAVIAAAALPVSVAEEVIPALTTTYSDLDALAVLWGIKRYCIEKTSGGSVWLIPIESDDSLCERLTEAIMPANPWGELGKQSRLSFLFDS